MSFWGLEPESEVPGIPFVRMFFETGTDFEFVESIARKSAVAIERGDIEEDIAIGGIGMVVRDELLDDAESFGEYGR
jgi:hypothetical protein